MTIHLRQICLVSDQFNDTSTKLSQLFSIPPCFTDPAVGKFGLENVLFAVGTKFIEIVSPTKPDTAAGRFLKRQGGDGGYMVICQVPTLEEQAEVRERATDNGVRIAYESDYDSWNIMQLHPADMGASFLELDWDEEADMNGNWHPAGGKVWQDKVSTEVISDIIAVELQSDDPDKLAKHWSAVIGIPVQHSENAQTIPLGNADLRFVHGTSEGMNALDIRVANKSRLQTQAEALGLKVSGDSVVVCGVRFNFIDK